MKKMGKFAKLFSAALLAAAAVFAGNLRGAESEFKTVAAVSFAGYNALYDSVEKIADLAGYKDTVAAFEMMIAQIEGLDKAKPFGAVVLTDGKEFIPFAFLPVADLDELQFPGIDDVKEDYNAETGIFTLDKEKDLKVLLFERDGWLFVTGEKMKEKIPAGDPLALLGGLDKEYLLGSCVYAENVPANLLDTLMSQLRQKLASLDEANAASFDALPEIADYLLESVRTISGGLAIDPATGDTRFVSECQLKDGSPMQEILKKNVNRTTKWSDFCVKENSVFAFVGSEFVNEKQLELVRKQQAAQLENLDKTLSTVIEDENQKTEIKKILDKFGEVQNATLERTRFDYASSLTSDGLLMFGADIGGGKSLIEALNLLKDYVSAHADKDVLELFKNTKINESTFAGYSVSTFVPTDEIQSAFAEFLPQLAEKSFAILLGVKDDAVILLAGIDKKRISDTFKKLAEAERTEKPLENPVVFFSLPQVGVLLDTIVPKESRGPLIETLMSGPKEAVVEVEQTVTADRTSAVLRINGAVYALIGDSVRSSLSVVKTENAEDEGLFDDKESAEEPEEKTAEEK